MKFTPGQDVKLCVAPFEWRDYSIAAAVDRKLTLLISNRTHGDGSHYADTVEPGAVTDFEGPLGGYHLEPGAHRKVFVATGTGSARSCRCSPIWPARARLGRRSSFSAAASLPDDLTRNSPPCRR